MMRVVLLLALSTFAWSQDVKPSLTVRPEASTHAKGFARGGVIGLAASHGERFYYVEGTGLSMKDTQARYSKKDLEKLEAKGIKITVEDTDNIRVVVAQ